MDLSKHPTHWLSRGVMACLLLIAATIIRADSVESKSGTTITGKIISRDAKEVAIEVTVNDIKVTRRFAIRGIKAITTNGVREVLDGSAPGPKPDASAGTTVERSRKEVEDLIKQTGSTPPDWLDATPLSFPQTLDLDFPAKPAGAWNNQKNVGQYMWDVINVNPGKWHEGAKLLYHLLDLHKNDAEVRARLAMQLAGMYHHLFLDYARAAYWFGQCAGQADPSQLAECYWKLGNKAMAIQMLNSLKFVTFSTIKLWADMGDPDRAIKTAQAFMNGAGAADADVLAGDACRLAGRTAQAIKFYEAAVATPDAPRNRRAKNRATASLEAVKLFDQLNLAKIPDGTYPASSMGYEHPLELEVKVVNHRIEEITITKHQEKQFYAAMTDTPAKIIQKQSVKGIDATSRATITSEAIINATAKALSGAMK